MSVEPGGRRIGIYGGTFDPPHIGHLIVASQILDELGLDEIRFVIARTPPHKTGLPVSPIEQRLAMLHLALDDDPHFVIDTIELDRAGLSYTAETVETLALTHPDDKLWFLMGGDSLDQFPAWHQPERIIGSVRLAVASRPGWIPDIGRLEAAVPGIAARTDIVPTTQIDVSSYGIRERVAKGRTIDWLVPRPVADYIEVTGIYRSTPQNRGPDVRSRRLDR